MCSWYLSRFAIRTLFESICRFFRAFRVVRGQPATYVNNQEMRHAHTFYQGYPVL